jgi:hypothetical protein
VFRGIRDAGLDIPMTVSAGNDIYPEMKQFAAIIPQELISAAPPNIVLETLPKRLHRHLSRRSPGDGGHSFRSSILGLEECLI